MAVARMTETAGGRTIGAGSGAGGGSGTGNGALLRNYKIAVIPVSQGAEEALTRETGVCYGGREVGLARCGRRRDNVNQRLAQLETRHGGRAVGLARCGGRRDGRGFAGGRRNRLRNGVNSGRGLFAENREMWCLRRPLVKP